MPSGLISMSSGLISRSRTSAISGAKGVVDRPWKELPQSTGFPWPLVAGGAAGRGSSRTAGGGSTGGAELFAGLDVDEAARSDSRWRGDRWDRAAEARRLLDAEATGRRARDILRAIVVEERPVVAVGRD